MSSINENLHNQAVREARQNDKQKEAWKIALGLYPLIKQSGEAVNNRDNTFEHTLANRIKRRLPIPFVGFWGIGHKPNIDNFDIGMIDNLRALGKQIKAEYEPGAKFTAIMADTHGIYNGFGNEEGAIFPQHRPYLHQVTEELKLSDIQTQLLSDLYFKWNMQLPNIRNPLDLDSETYQTLMLNYDQYIRSAQSHNLRGVDKIQAAYHYVAMRLQERAMLAQAFPDTILFVNGGKKLADPLMPKQMPILYLRQSPVWFRQVPN